MRKTTHRRGHGKRGSHGARGHKRTSRSKKQQAAWLPWGWGGGMAFPGA